MSITREEAVTLSESSDHEGVDKLIDFIDEVFAAAETAIETGETETLEELKEAWEG